MEVKGCLEAHQNTFFQVPFDKASNNITFKYKRYYVGWTLKEIGVTEHGNIIYCKTKKSCDELTDESLGLWSHWKRKKLPIMYWISKIHNNLTGACLIIASKICSTK